MSFFSEIQGNKKLMFALALGLCLRVLFILFGAHIYFGRENIYVDGDTQVWVSCIQNLIETGTYTMHPGHEYGYFGRTPGYSFFIGIFYLLTGKDWNAAYPLIAWTQLLLDVIAIFIVYKIGLKLFKGDNKTALIGAFLYATYPFIIVWTPVAYSESISIFFLLISFYYLINDEKKYNYFHSGIFLSLAILCRPQLLLLTGIFGLFILFRHRQNLPVLLKKGLQYCLAIAIVYGSWPIRNYINYGKIELTHDLRGFEVWNIDALAFREYIYSVKAEWEPQFSNILHNETVTFPKEAYLTKEDSLKLERVIYLSKNCGSGFSHWKGYWKEPVTKDNCNEEIKQLYDELRVNQVRENTLNYYVYIPLKNFQKAIFKFKLYNTTSAARQFASLLFIYRTLMILLGIAGACLLFKSGAESRYSSIIIISFFLILYTLICAGTGPDFRNIEMRYFLPADVLLLICASVSLKKISEKIKKIG